MAASTPAAEAAQRYVARGFAVVPMHLATGGRCSCMRPDCPSPGKHPRVRWQRFERQAPAAAQVASWWRRWPDASVGVITGTVSRLLVLDVDPRNGGAETMAALEERGGALPAAPETRTGGGGRHLWFALGAPLASGPLGPGVDVKADGGIVIAPPSRHASGGVYEWRPGRGLDDVALVSPPAWLVALAAARTGPALRGERAGAARRAGVPPRTAQERAEFAEAWARAGVIIRPGDHGHRCPFHDDRHPSLHVDADGCRWHCFGCGLGGGIGALRCALDEERTPRPRDRLTRLAGAADSPVTLVGMRDVEVVGESRFQDELLALTGGVRRYGGVDAHTVAELVPQPDAALDSAAGPDAVAVRVQGRTVGHLRAEDARRYREAIDAAARARGAATCRARIRGGWDRGGGDVGAFGVRLMLPDIDDAAVAPS